MVSFSLLVSFDSAPKNRQLPRDRLSPLKEEKKLIQLINEKVFVEEEERSFFNSLSLELCLESFRFYFVENCGNLCMHRHKTKELSWFWVFFIVII